MRNSRLLLWFKLNIENEEGRLTGCKKTRNGTSAIIDRIEEGYARRDGDTPFNSLMVFEN